MANEIDLQLLDSLGKGKKSQKVFHLSSPFAKQHTAKYQHYRKGSQSTYTSAYSTKDMLRIANKQTQAIFKISSYGHGEKKIAAHMRYISRCGKLELEDQDGNKLCSTKEQKALLNDWSVNFSSRERSRDTMHLVLSTPPKTNREHALQAAKEFLQKEYKAAGHDYVFVAHNDTDHPHVHAVIKMVSHIDKKLNPRKCYLRQVRKDYAEICRSHGINVEASSRCERGLSGQSERSEFVQMRRNNRKPNVDINLLHKVRKERLAYKFPIHASEDKMKTRNHIIRKLYADKAIELSTKAQALEDGTEKTKYLNDAHQLDEFANALPDEITRGEKMHRELDTKLGVPKNRRHLAEIYNKQQAVIGKNIGKGAALERELDL